MKPILNIIWLVCCGFWMSLAYVFAGVIACIFIVTIPFGIASFRIANLALWPFGRTAVPVSGSAIPSFIGNVIWFLVAGWWLALGHILSGMLLFCTIIGILLAVASFKLIPISLAPLGKQIVRTDHRY